MGQDLLLRSDAWSVVLVRQGFHRLAYLGEQLARFILGLDLIRLGNHILHRRHWWYHCSHVQKVQLVVVELFELGLVNLGSRVREVQVGVTFRIDHLNVLLIDAKRLMGPVILRFFVHESLDDSVSLALGLILFLIQLSDVLQAVNAACLLVQLNECFACGVFDLQHLRSFANGDTLFLGQPDQGTSGVRADGIILAAEGSQFTASMSQAHSMADIVVIVK